MKSVGICCLVVLVLHLKDNKIHDSWDMQPTAFLFYWKLLAPNCEYILIGQLLSFFVCVF